MQREYNYTLTLPLADLDAAMRSLAAVQQHFVLLRIRRKPDRQGRARLYLRFPQTGGSPDVVVQRWFDGVKQQGWDLFGPNDGIWGLN
ncbi:MAG: hypothetical protein V2I32_02500 [Desulforhopalus sp.]|jgi:hypothetical protein|nr:hypothetical protein [Desulforhopalus sp.]